MPDTTITDEDEVLIPPVLPEEELEEVPVDEVPDPNKLDAVDQQLLREFEREVEESEKPKKKKRSGKKGKKLPPDVVERMQTSREMDIDEWIAMVDAKYHWDRPGTKCVLVRTYPQWYNKVRTAGIVAERDGGVFTMAEIQQEFGGGEYEMQCVMPADGPGLPPRKLRKKFSVVGEPRRSAMEHPDQGGTGAPESYHPAVERGMVGLVKNTQDQLYKAMAAQHQGPNLEQVRIPYQQATEMAKDSFEREARAREDAAARLAQHAEERTREAKAEAELAKRQLEETQRETGDRIRAATEGANTMVAALIPSFNENAARQVEHIVRTFEAREARIEQGHMKEVESLNRTHEAQMRQQQMLQQAEVSRMEATFQSQLGLVSQQLQHHQQQAERLHAENTRLRDDLMQFRVTQIESMRQERDPMTKLGEMHQFMEVVKELPGIGGGGGSDELGEDAAPYMKLINNALNTVGPVLGEVLQAKQQQPQMQQLPPGMHPGMVPQGAMVQQPPQPQPPQPPPGPPPTRLRREDVRQIVTAFSGIFQAGSTAEQAAGAALQHLPHDVLRLLAKKPPEKVVEEFESAGFLADSPLQMGDGRAFAVAVLTELRKKL